MTYIKESTELAKAIEFADGDGGTAFAAMRAAVSDAYPEAVEEVEGMAEGLGVNATVVFILQMVPELLSLAEGRGPAAASTPPTPPTPSGTEQLGERFRLYNAVKGPAEASTPPTPSGRAHQLPGGKACSDVMVVSSSAWALAHNEDASPRVVPGAYLVNATVTLADRQPARYLALCYPGTLCGNAFAWLPAAQTAITCNAVFPNSTRRDGLPRNFVTHATLAATSLEDALVRSLAAPRAYGFSVNVANATDMFNVEVSPSAHAVVHANPIRGFLEHFNMYKHLVPPEGQLDDPSTVHRSAAAAKHGQPASLSDALSILGDTSDPAYPVYRNATVPDDCATVATAAFDFRAGAVRVYGGNPASTVPLLELAM